MAISLRPLGIEFERWPVSVFRHVDTFVTINPLVMAPHLTAHTTAAEQLAAFAKYPAND